MRKQYRVHISIRSRGQAPMDSRELKSENFDEYEDFAQAVSEVVLENIFDDEEGEDDD